MYELALRFRHECPYTALSTKFPRARISLWDNLKMEFLEVRSSERDEWPGIDRALNALAKGKGSKVLRKISDGKSYQFVIMTCACERKGTTLDWIIGSDCLFVPPIRLREGVETYHAVGFDRGAAGRLLSQFRKNGDAEMVDQKRIDSETMDQLSFLPLVDPLLGMTRMQVNALATSMSLGYYRLPRQTSTGKIAASLKIPRTTFQEHRKKAETKLMAALAPYVLTYVAGGN